METTPDDLVRFWSKVEKSEGCWLWTGGKRNGYGLFKLKNKSVSAHRLSYFLEYGEVYNRQVCHSCDTPACVNPKHLSLGTAKANSDDKMIKDRHNFPLSNEQVKNIRNRPLSYTMCRDLAKEFNVSSSTIKKVVTGDIYAWLPGARDIPAQFTGWTLTPEQVEKIWEASKTPKWGWQNKLAKEFGVGRATINHVYKKRLQYASTDTQ